MKKKVWWQKCFGKNLGDGGEWWALLRNKKSTTDTFKNVEEWYWNERIYSTVYIKQQMSMQNLRSSKNHVNSHTDKSLAILLKGLA